MRCKYNHTYFLQENPRFDHIRWKVAQNGYAHKSDENQSAST